MDEALHIEKAQHNEKVLQFLKDHDLNVMTNFPDWMVTIAFYVALQYVDAQLAKIANKHPADHYQRNTLVSKYLPTLRGLYFSLNSKSRIARYIPGSEKHISPTAAHTYVNIGITAFK